MSVPFLLSSFFKSYNPKKQRVLLEKEEFLSLAQFSTSLTTVNNKKFYQHRTRALSFLSLSGDFDDLLGENTQQKSHCWPQSIIADHFITELSTLSAGGGGTIIEIILKTVFPTAPNEKWELHH